MTRGHHANAALTPRHRLKVARLVVDDGWPISEVAARFQVSWPTVKRWVDRYLVGESMQDRSSRPRTSPNKTPKSVTKRCVSLRMRLREGPVQLASRLDIAPSTVHRILTTARMNRLSYVDRATGEPVRRYEHPHPRSLVHVDVKKVGNIPDSGGWRYVGRRQGEKNRAATTGKPRNQYGGPKLGYAFVHTVIDDHSRVAYIEVHDDETAITAVAVLRLAVQVVRRPWRHHRAGAVGQRWGVPLSPVAQHLPWPVDHAETDPPVPPADQWEDGALPPDDGRRVGLRPLLHQRARTPRRTRAVAGALQRSATAYRVR